MMKTKLCETSAPFAPLRLKTKKGFYPNQTWNLSALSDGVYVMSVVLESGRVISERLVKQ